MRSTVFSHHRLMSDISDHPLLEGSEPCGHFHTTEQQLYNPNAKLPLLGFHIVYSTFILAFHFPRKQEQNPV